MKLTVENFEELKECPLGVFSKIKQIVSSAFDSESNILKKN